MIFNVRVKLSREKDGLKCIAWASRCKNAIVIDSSGELKLQPRPPSETMVQGPTRATDTDLANAGIKYLGITPTDAGQRLIIESKFGEKRIPFGDFVNGARCVVPGYKFATVTKETNNKKNYGYPVSVLIVDIEALTLCCEIEYPKDLPHCNPVFVLDPKTNGFVVVEWNLAWMMVVDLEPLFKKATAKEQLRIKN